MTQNLTINGERLWDSLMSMGELGGTAAGGCNRQALTDLDKQGRDLFVQWCREAGCEIRVDAMGNIFARRPGKDSSLPAVATGSHLDTQPTGGKFDGVYGVLAGLEVMRSLNEHKVETQAPIEVVVWTNEEGARFSPAMIGSAVWCGEFSLEYGHDRKDKNGCTIGGELERIGYAGEEPCEPSSMSQFIEVHIEQGPILEAEQLQIGVVQGVQGMHWYDLTITGSPVHAGPTPMDSRKDPFMAFHRVVSELYEMVAEYGPDSRLTFGDIKAEPGARNTVPEKLVVAVDLRHPDQKILDQMDERFRAIAAENCEKLELACDIRDEWRSPAVSFASDCIDAVLSSVEQLNYPFKSMFSGAGHDSVYVSRVVPTSMIFIPCKDGISHNEAEFAEPKDIEAGANVLLHSLVALANGSLSD